MAPATPYALFLLGLLGTAHCMGMCGPLVIAVPGHAGGVRHQFAYHLGRVSTYTMISAAMGAVGAALNIASRSGGPSPLLTLARIQVGLSLVSALLLLTMGLFRLRIVPEPSWLTLAAPTRWPGFVQLLRRGASGHDGALISLGLLLGLLPCGLSYGAFAAALSTGSVGYGALLGASFGLGTLPGAMLLGTAFAASVRKHQRFFDVLSGVLLLGIAASMVATGLAATL
jgi:uncharacterized protein